MRIQGVRAERVEGDGQITPVASPRIGVSWSEVKSFANDPGFRKHELPAVNLAAGIGPRTPHDRQGRFARRGGDRKAR